MSGKPLKETLPQRCESILSRLPDPGPSWDYAFSMRVLILPTAMKRFAARESIDFAMMEEVIDAAMKARRLFEVEGPDGRTTIRQHPAPASAPRRKH